MFIRVVFLICCLAVSGLNAQYWRNWLPVKEGNYWGFIDEEGKIKEPCKYTEYLKEYNVIKLWDGKNLTVYEDTGKRIYPEGINDFVHLGQAFYAAYKEGKCYLSRKDGTPVFEGKYDYLLATKTAGLYEFCAKGKNGVIDSTGKVILEFPLVAFKSLKRGVFSVHRDSKFHIFNAGGAIIVVDTFKKIEVWDNGAELVSGVYDNNGGRIVDFEGKEVFRYDHEIEIRYLGNGFLLCSDKQKRTKVYDLILKKMLPVSLSQGRRSEIASTFLYKNKGLWFFYFRGDTLPREGYKDIVSEPEWFRVKNIQNKTGFFDKNLNQIVPFEYDDYLKINDNLIGLSKKDSGYGVFAKASLKRQTPLIYNSFALGDNYLKAYAEDNKMEMYDLDEAGNLTNKTIYQNVRRFYISDRTGDNSDQFIVPAGTSSGGSINVESSTVQEAPKSRIEYKVVEGRYRVSVIICDTANGHCDTLERRYYDSICYRNERYTIVEKREVITGYDSVYQKKKSKQIKKQFLIDNQNFRILDTAFDYISITDVFYTQGNSDFRAIKMNAKYVLVNKETFSMSEEYDYLSAREYGFRRRVKQGRWTETKTKTGLYEGNLRNKKYWVYGVWELVEEKTSKVREIKGLDNSKITYMYPLFLNTCIAQFSYDRVFVFDTTGKVIIPCQYNNITTAYISGQYYFVCGKDSVKYTILNKEGNLINSEKYNQLKVFESVTELKDDKGKLMMNSSGKFFPLDQKALLLSFDKGKGLLKFQKNIHAVNENLQPLTAESYKEIYPFIGNYTLAKTEKGWGILDTGFAWIKPPQQKEKCGPVFKNSFLMGAQGSRKFVAFDGKPVVSPDKGMIPQREIINGVYEYSQNNRTILADRYGRIIEEFVGVPKTEIIGDYLLYHLNIKTIKGVVLDTRSGKKHEIDRLYDLGEVGQQAYDENKLRNNIIDFYDYQKEIYGCKKYFTPVLIKANLYAGMLNCGLYKMGLVGKEDPQANNMLGFTGSTVTIYGNRFLLCRFSGRPFTYAPIKNVRLVDSAGMLLTTGSGKSAVMSEHGTWIIPPVVRNIRKMSGNFYGCEHPVYYHLYTFAGKKLEPEFTEYNIVQNTLVLWKYNRLMYYKPADRKILWEENGF